MFSLPIPWSLVLGQVVEQRATETRGSPLLLPELETRQLRRVETPGTAATRGCRLRRGMGVHPSTWRRVSRLERRRGCLYWHYAPRCRRDLRDAALFSVEQVESIYTSSNLLLVTVQMNKLYKKLFIFPPHSVRHHQQVYASFILDSGVLLKLGVASGREPVPWRMNHF